ncbi:MAG: 4-(cytidine 5'-diphospho)-2-C-methyl-D-erythritol kinase [Eubacterium sp.]|nr:4-(cytidine 5'-diphospho)-2-C-methyl-D-erythritol kinase [Eubacterium sp.]
MNLIVEKAYAKVNLGLDVLSRREDGYHEVKMIMQQIDLFDEIEISTGFIEGGITIESSDKSLPENSDNLCYKAAELIREMCDVKIGLHIKIDKHIPVAAGMAGGSTDAAAVLRGINRLFMLELSDDELRKMAEKLGADVPFCVSGGCMLSEGIGEILSPVKGLSEVPMLVAKPQIGVSTKWVYENLDLSKVTHPDIDGQLEALKKGDINTVCKLMGNVLESVTEEEYDVIRQIKGIMKEEGALGAMMSGSGPTVFGIFENLEQLKGAYNKMKESALAKDVIMTKPYNGRPDME